ncbi:hypothetical protein BDW60DRAFT_184994 [Aspergillus nidulans var. acristatus]
MKGHILEQAYLPLTFCLACRFNKPQYPDYKYRPLSRICCQCSGRRARRAKIIVKVHLDLQQRSPWMKAWSRDIIPEWSVYSDKQVSAIQPL